MEERKRCEAVWKSWGEFSFPPVLELYYGGVTMGDPGVGGAGGTISIDGDKRGAFALYVGESVTPLQAEFHAFVLGLRKILEIIQSGYYYHCSGSYVVAYSCSNSVKNQVKLLEPPCPLLEDLMKEAASILEALQCVYYDIEFVHVNPLDCQEALQFAKKGWELEKVKERMYMCPSNFPNPETVKFEQKMRVRCVKGDFQVHCPSLLPLPFTVDLHVEKELVLPPIEVFFKGLEGGGLGFTLDELTELDDPPHHQRMGYARYIGDKEFSPVQAEYAALTLALDKVLKFVEVRDTTQFGGAIVMIKGDSEVVINEMRGKVRKKYFTEFCEALSRVAKLKDKEYEVEYTQVGKVLNQRATSLAEQATAQRLNKEFSLLLW